jgi:hypothetical protein
VGFTHSAVPMLYCTGVCGCFVHHTVAYIRHVDSNVVAFESGLGEGNMLFGYVFARMSSCLEWCHGLMGIARRRKWLVGTSKRFEGIASCTCSAGDALCVGVEVLSH